MSEFFDMAEATREQEHIIRAHARIDASSKQPSNVLFLVVYFAVVSALILWMR